MKRLRVVQHDARQLTAKLPTRTVSQDSNTIGKLAPASSHQGDGNLTFGRWSFQLILDRLLTPPAPDGFQQTAMAQSLRLAETLVCNARFRHSLHCDQL